MDFARREELGGPNGVTTFVMAAVKHDAQYWTAETIAEELSRNGMADPESALELEALRDQVLRALVGRSGERFWANEAITAPRAAAIRSACEALNALAVQQGAKPAGRVEPEAAPKA